MELLPMTLAKGLITSSLESRLGFSTSSRAPPESFLEVIKGALADGDYVSIRGFAELFVRQKVAQRDRKPATGEELNSGPRKVVVLNRSTVVTEKLNV
jgi:nucleoid DNA-binding protein